MPASALLSIKSVPKSFRAKHGGITVHGLLASFLAFDMDESGIHGPWKASWPSPEDFKSSMPLLWPPSVRKSLPPNKPAHESVCFPLPPAVGGRWAHPQMRDFWNARNTCLLLKQEKKLNSDWEIVSKLFPDEPFEKYRYYWLIVNTRGFYWEFPGEKLPKRHDDRLVLAPWMDLFNHSDRGCNVSFDKDGYVVTSDRAYGKRKITFVPLRSRLNSFR